MAITWIDKDYKVVKVTHEGLVLVASETRCERVMSDIYSDETYAQVWNPEKGEAEWIHINSCFELFAGPRGLAVVDATPETLKARDEWKAELDRKHQYEERLVAEYNRKQAWDSPERGKQMRVVRGRKVAKGTEGLVFWVREGRVGLALDDQRDSQGHFVNVAWVDATYLENVIPCPIQA
ncbi:MAG: hypothetical protein WC824_14830 [Bacteroidota bacterium]|jgi:hypothetical protein